MLTATRITLYLLVFWEHRYVSSFSISRLFRNFPKHHEITSFFTSLRGDSPKLLIDWTAFNGLDGCKLQPPSGGDGGSHLGFLPFPGDERWHKGLLVMPLLVKNDTGSTSSIRYLSSGDAANRSKGSRGVVKKDTSRLMKWWQRNTADSKGLLIYLLPAVCAQFTILRTAVPFFLDRLSQYLQPIYMGLSFLLLQKRGASIVQATLWSSVLIGGYFMLSDTYNAGSSWVPLQAKDDSYALITGASSGIGLELARLLYLDGFSLILISRQGDSLEQLKALLQRDEAVGAVPDVPQPSPTTPSPSSPPPSSSTPSQAYGYDGYQGGDDSAAAGMRGKQDGYSPHPGGQDGPVRVSGGGVHRTTERRSAPPPTAQKHAQKAGSKSSMRKLSSSTSYKSNRVYDRDYELDEFYGDSSDAVEKEEVKAKSVVPHVQEIVTIPCDLAEAGSAVEIMKELKRMGIDDKIDVMVNNAGSAVRGAFMLSPLEGLTETLDLNVKASVMLTRLLAPRIARRGTGGRILFIGSLSSVGPGPTVAVYAATKAFLQSFAMSLRREMISHGVFVTLALPGAIKDRDYPFSSKAGADDALIFRGPGLSLSVERTALDIYAGLKQGRDVVVPGIVNKLYTYLFSQILPSAAVGAITQTAWSPAPKWLPFLKPLASEVLLQEEQQRQKRRLKERQELERAETLRAEKMRKQHLMHSRRQRHRYRPFSGLSDEDQAEEDGAGKEVERDEVREGNDFDIHSGKSSSGDVILKKGAKRNKIQKFAKSVRQSVTRKRAFMSNMFRNVTGRLHLPSKHDIIEGCDPPVPVRREKESDLRQQERGSGEEVESELERRLREDIEKERRKREQGDDVASKGPLKIFKNAHNRLRKWALGFWYRPVIDYSAIREWAAVPFRPKGQDIVIDEEAEGEGKGEGKVGDVPGVILEPSDGDKHDTVSDSKDTDIGVSAGAMRGGEEVRSSEGCTDDPHPSTTFLGANDYEESSDDIIGDCAEYLDGLGMDLGQGQVIRSHDDDEEEVTSLCPPEPSQSLTYCAESADSAEVESSQLSPPSTSSSSHVRLVSPLITSCEYPRVSDNSIESSAFSVAVSQLTPSVVEGSIAILMQKHSVLSSNLSPTAAAPILGVFGDENETVSSLPFLSIPLPFSALHSTLIRTLAQTRGRGSLPVSVSTDGFSDDAGEEKESNEGEESEGGQGLGPGAGHPLEGTPYSAQLPSLLGSCDEVSSAGSPTVSRGASVSRNAHRGEEKGRREREDVEVKSSSAAYRQYCSAPFI